MGIYKEKREYTKKFDSSNFNNRDFFEHSIKLFSKNERYYYILLSSKGDPYFVEKCKEKLKESLRVYINKNNIIVENDKEIIMEYIVSGMVGCISYWFKTKPFSEIELLQILTTLMEDFNQQFNLKYW